MNAWRAMGLAAESVPLGIAATIWRMSSEVEWAANLGVRIEGNDVGRSCRHSGRVTVDAYDRCQWTKLFGRFTEHIYLCCSCKSSLCWRSFSNLRTRALWSWMWRLRLLSEYSEWCRHRVRHRRPKLSSSSSNTLGNLYQRSHYIPQHTCAIPYRQGRRLESHAGWLLSLKSSSTGDSLSAFQMTACPYLCYVLISESVYQ